MAVQRPRSPAGRSADERGPVRLALSITPARHLIVRAVEADGDEPIAPEAAERIGAAFEAGAGAGLLQLGTAEVTTALPPALGYWRDLAARYVAAVCARGEDTATPTAPPDDASLAALAHGAPPMVGGEYLDAALLAEHWQALDAAFVAALHGAGGGVAGFLQARHAAWHLVGRVHFNLAENRGDDDAPFAFLATYTTRLSARATAQHVALGQALREYAGARAKPQLAALLAPVRRAADACSWLAEMVERGELFHPMRWTSGEAARLLTDLPKLEAAGVVVRMPAGWGGRRPARPQATAVVGARPAGGLGRDALLDFRAAVTLDGEDLTEREIAELLAGTDGLRLLRGRWIELDRAELRATIDRLHAIERAAAGGIGFSEAMRLVAGAAIDDAPDDDAEARPRVIAGAWLAETLAGLRTPAGLAAVEPGDALRAELRPYQAVGVRWLHLLAELGLGACLADDMGLGKTMQIIALLLTSRRRPGRGLGPPHLLVAPASLLGNWTAELARFAPALRPRVAHPSAMPAAELGGDRAPDLAGTDLVITSYGTLARAPWLTATRWGLAILDEAQAIKNPGTRQTRAVKALQAHARVALTGTPVENRLGDLWSIFDFLNPGLLGSAKDFTRYTRALDARGYGPLRELIRPYLLRRLKTDRTVIADLPDKTELTAYCALSRKQAALYQQAVDDLAETLRDKRGIERRGAVLASLLRFKQICNHPSQWLGDHDWREADSGKLLRVRELAEVIAAKQDKLLVFTQFRETCEPLAAFLAGVFGRPGLVLHGNTAVQERSALVRQFQDDEAIPFFVLSLKAGGTGLNLTAASHVLHFDRWWNPAVEDQATDRAFRIGQHRNVLVHKLVCRGTVEEKIDALIADKRALSRQLLEGSAELRLTELSDTELMNLVTLDLNSAMMDGAASAAKEQPR
ncbi:MAG TPA: DEAD/DEAH box helicase [Kofleriaceae bacterium]|jgi:non-specific serine/threonine protein kinase|nr:DEAD/DEAH box helicase [Kofleriaceae bacterium]